jgi:hypothetical protein
VDLAESAVELARSSSDLELEADALVDLGDILTILGRRDEAAARLSEALELYSRKGDRVSASQYRAEVSAIG